jgi:hypothetical protein
LGGGKAKILKSQYIVTLYNKYSGADLFFCTGARIFSLTGILALCLEAQSPYEVAQTF